MQFPLRRALAALAAAAVGLIPIVTAPAMASASGPVGSNPLSQKDYESLDQAVQALEAGSGQSGGLGTESALPDPVDELVALVPQSVYDQYPQYESLIRGTTTPEVVYSGASIPPCIAQGSQLLPGFPPPYGYYALATNNFCLPNGPNGGCDVVSDMGLTFDFRAACRQHDLGYQFAPTTRADIDNRFLVDMGSDCARRGGWRAWQQPFCYTRVAIRYAFVSAFGWVGYGNSPKPGYNQPVPPTGRPTRRACRTPTGCSTTRRAAPPSRAARTCSWPGWYG